MKSLPALFALTLSTLLVACGGSSEEDSAATEGAVNVTSEGSKLTAKLTKREIEETTGRCTTSVTVLEVSGIDAQAATTINAALQRNRKEHLDAAECSKGEDSFEYNGTMTAMHNAKGYLSIHESASTFSEGRRDMYMVGHNFDLATGKSIAIKDLFTAAGIDEAIEVCTKGMRELTEYDDYEADHCAFALREGVTSTFGPDGIRVHPVATAADFVIVAEGALIPWSAIEKKLSPLGVAVLDSTK